MVRNDKQCCNCGQLKNAVKNWFTEWNGGMIAPGQGFGQLFQAQTQNQPSLVIPVGEMAEPYPIPLDAVIYDSTGGAVTLQPDGSLQISDGVWQASFQVSLYTAPVGSNVGLLINGAFTDLVAAARIVGNITDSAIITAPVNIAVAVQSAAGQVVLPAQSPQINIVLVRAG